jgi:hypothetical protein
MYAPRGPIAIKNRNNADRRITADHRGSGGRLHCSQPAPVPFGDGPGVRQGQSLQCSAERTARLVPIERRAGRGMARVRRAVFRHPFPGFAAQGVRRGEHFLCGMAAWQAFHSVASEQPRPVTEADLHEVPQGSGQTTARLRLLTHPRQQAAQPGTDLHSAGARLVGQQPSHAPSLNLVVNADQP